MLKGGRKKKGNTNTSNVENFHVVQHFSVRKGKATITRNATKGIPRGTRER